MIDFKAPVRLTFSEKPLVCKALTHGEKLRLARLIWPEESLKVHREEHETNEEYAERATLHIVKLTTPESLDEIGRFLAEKITEIDGITDPKEIAEYLLYGPHDIMTFLSIGSLILQAARLGPDERKNLSSSSDGPQPAGN
jgi:hypothetical protein